jgi:hypothetical protein
VGSEQAVAIGALLLMSKAMRRKAAAVAAIKCEVNHMHPALHTLWIKTFRPKGRPMSTRRKMVWWFRFVMSGRFLETFLNLRNRRS